MRRADLDDRDAADELGEALLELLAVVVAGGVLDLLADRFDAALDLGLRRRRRRRCVVLSLSIVTRLARPRSLMVTFSSLRPSSSVMTWPPVRTAMSLSISLRRSPKPGALTAAHVERAAELVDDERGQRLALDVLGDDEERLAAARDRLEHREEILHVGDLLLADEDVGVLEHDLHPLGVGHEVGREVAAVELHALDHLERRLGRLALLDGDDAFLADLLHRLGEDRCRWSSSPLALMVPTCAISFGSLVGLAQLLEARRRSPRRPCRCRA